MFGLSGSGFPRTADDSVNCDQHEHGKGGQQNVVEVADDSRQAYKPKSTTRTGVKQHSAAVTVPTTPILRSLSFTLVAPFKFLFVFAHPHETTRRQKYDAAKRGRQGSS